MDGTGDGSGSSGKGRGTGASSPGAAEAVTGAGPAGLSVRGLTVAYGSLQAVSGVDLEVAPGEVVALLGASGCGKSSLLRAVAGLEDVARGQVRWDGQDMVGVPVHRRGFGLMFQDGQLFEHRDVAGNVAYGLSGLPRARRAERVEEMLALVGLSGLEGRRVATLSGGQAQRVALARSLAPSPRLLLLDEPLSALDRALREQLVVDLRAILRQQGTTALYVTHDQDEAMAVADRVGVMSQGLLLRVDSPERLWADPGSREVAQFLGFGPFLDARAVGCLDARDAGRLDDGAVGARSGAPDRGAGGSGGCLALAPGALWVEGQVPSSPCPEAAEPSGEERSQEGVRPWSEEQELSGLGVGSGLGAGWARLTGTVQASRLRRGQWEAEVRLDVPGALGGSAAPGGSVASECPGRADTPDLLASPGRRAPAGAVARAGRAYQPGERVLLILDLARAAPVAGGAPPLRPRSRGGWERSEGDEPGVTYDQAQEGMVAASGRAGGWA